MWIVKLLGMAEYLMQQTIFFWKIYISKENVKKK